MSINWFKLNRAAHRDIGYFCIGMTIIFAVSGIAVNHIDDFNPNYAVSYEQIELPGLSQYHEDKIQEVVLAALPFEFELRTVFWQSPEQLKLFGQNDINITADLTAETLSVERIEQRLILSTFNALHLNELKGPWTYFSDLYAIMLLFLASSALFMVKGKKGVWSKRGLFVVAGIVMPVIFVLV